MPPIPPPPLPPDAPGLTEAGILLRPERPADLRFLQRLYNSTRTAEMDAADWPRDIRRRFLADQFEAQQRHFATTLGDMARHVVLARRQPAGRLYLLRKDVSLHVVDISLLPEYCGKGLGTALIRAVQAAAARDGVDASLSVLASNLPAQRLYERLGFAVTGQHGFHLSMAWEHPATGG